MQKKGVKKTTVDELVKRVGIPKGTFYLFYPSLINLIHYYVFQTFYIIHHAQKKDIPEGISF